MATHKNKTLTSFLAAVFGCAGIHRFYLNGMRDKWGWLHLISLPISFSLSHLYIGWPAMLAYAPLILSLLIAQLEALVLGLTPDEKWDNKYNPASDVTSASSWPLALLMVLTVGIGATILIATIARTFDLLYTGGAYG